MKTIIHSLFILLSFSVTSVAMAHSGHHASPEHLHLAETAAVVVTILLGLTAYFKFR